MADPITPTERNILGIIYIPAGTVPSLEIDTTIKVENTADGDLKVYVNDSLVYGE